MVRLGALRNAPVNSLDATQLEIRYRLTVQMFGLSWVDQPDAFSDRYVHVILADHNSVAERDPNRVLEWIRANGFRDVKDFIVIDRGIEESPRVTTPTRLHAYALLSGTLRAEGGLTVTDTNKNTGLRWDIDRYGGMGLASGQQVLHHAWRADAGDGAYLHFAPSKIHDLARSENRYCQ